MKHRYFILAALLISASISASDFEDQTFQNNAGPTFNIARFKLGCIPKIQGYLAGIHFDWIHSKPSRFYMNLEFDGRWNAGFVCGDLDTKSQIKDYRTQFDVGYNWFLSDEKQSFITPFVGVGFYHLSHELKPCNIMTYRYFNVFVPVGINALWCAKEDRFDIGLQFYYRADAWTRLKMTIPCIETCDKIELKRSHGFHAEMPFIWYHSWNRRANFQTKIVPFFDWNRFGRADEANCNGICLNIPRLDQWYLGLHIDLGIRF